jgi:uncharacterized protein
VIAFHSGGQGPVVGFHSENLQVARLDEQAWLALAEPSRAAATARGEILAWSRERDPAASDGIEPQEIRYLSINVAQACNLACAYCAAGGDGTFGEAKKQIDLEKAYAQLERFLLPLPRGASFTLNFLGGEPLLAPRALAALVARAQLLVAGRKIDLTYKITTNATLLAPPVADFLARHRFHAQVSLDGPPVINDASRPTAAGRPSTALAMRGAAELFARRAQLGSISVNAVHGAHNANAAASYEFLRQYPWDRISLTFDAHCGDAETSARFAASCCDVAEAAWSYGGEKELRRLHEFEVVFSILDSQRRNRNFCGAGKSQLLMDASARLYACYWWASDQSEQLSNASGQLDRERLAAFSAPLLERHGCGACWARHICGGGCMHINKINSGDKHRRDEGFCERVRKIIGKGIELYERSRRSAGD